MATNCLSKLFADTCIDVDYVIMQLSEDRTFPFDTLLPGNKGLICTKNGTQQVGQRRI